MWKTVEIVSGQGFSPKNEASRDTSRSEPLSGVVLLAIVAVVWFFVS